MIEKVVERAEHNYLYCGAGKYFFKAHKLTWTCPYMNSVAAKSQNV